MFNLFELKLFKREPQWKYICNLILENSGFLCLWHALMCYRFEGFGVVENINEKKEKYKTQLEKSGEIEVMVPCALDFVPQR